VKYLLDTGIFLWSMDQVEKLNAQAQAVLTASGADELYLSAASSWEISIKARIGKLDLPEPPPRYVPDRMRRQDIRALPVSHTHTLAVFDLPRHHNDPFDRLLVAQAQSEGMTLMTADPAIRKYHLEILWCGL
jgi:PIN domain nuclease of toxin-antitoxin system